MRRRHRFLRLLAVALAFGLVAAACSSDDDDSGGGDGALAVVAGFDGTTIKVGMLSPQSDAVAVIGGPLTNGHLVYYDYVNTELGGIAGKYLIEPVVGDITYADTTTTKREYDRIKSDVVMFSQILGTPHINEVLDDLETDGIVAAPATLDSAWVNEPNLLPVGAPYQMQAANGIDYYINEDGGSVDDTICSARIDTEYGDAGLAGVEHASEEIGFAFGDAQTSTHSQGDTDFTTTIARAADCDMVFLTSLPTEAGTILGTAAAAVAAGNLSPDLVWYLQSPSYIGLFASSEALLPYLVSNVRVVAEGTEWDDTEVAGQVALVERAATYAPEQGPDYYFGFGYAQAIATVALLEKAVELGDLSHEGIQNALADLGEVDFDGISGTYDYGETREPPRASTVYGVDGDRPYGLTALARGYLSEAAENFEL